MMQGIIMVWRDQWRPAGSSLALEHTALASSSARVGLTAGADGTTGFDRETES